MPTKPDWSAERELWKQGYVQVAGVDEVGRGPLAGPVMAAAVVFSPTFKTRNLPGLNDSKKLSALARERLSPRIQHYASGVGIGRAEHHEIDALGIVEATRTAMTHVEPWNRPIGNIYLLLPPGGSTSIIQPKTQSPVAVASRSSTSRRTCPIIAIIAGGLTGIHHSRPFCNGP